MPSAAGNMIGSRALISVPIRGTLQSVLVRGVRLMRRGKTFEQNLPMLLITPYATHMPQIRLPDATEYLFCILPNPSPQDMSEARDKHPIRLHPTPPTPCAAIQNHNSHEVLQRTNARLLVVMIHLQSSSVRRCRVVERLNQRT